ncbi:MAG: transcriptional regulator [Candidatus Kariarchaeaceae archaeon]|jgi:DNA-binding MarR family transcriptional regulator
MSGTNSEEIRNPLFNSPLVTDIDIYKQLMNLKFYLNPVRLLILKVLDQNYFFTASSLRKTLKIPWGTFNDHIKALRKKELIDITDQFIDDSPSKTIFITNNGRRNYKRLIKTLITSLELS